jgi:N-formylglutamate deformylase
MRPFSVIEPTAEETPLVVEVPHAGLLVDGPTLALLAAPARAIGRDADLYVDELYADAPSHGATAIVAHVSRYICDLNRAETDIDAESVEGAPANSRATRGIVWRLTSDGSRVLDAPLPRAELERRLDTYYRPYHRAIATVLERKRAKFGFAILLAAHSMHERATGIRTRRAPTWSRGREGERRLRRASSTSSMPMHGRLR